MGFPGKCSRHMKRCKRGRTETMKRRQSDRRAVTRLSSQPDFFSIIETTRANYVCTLCLQPEPLLCRQSLPIVVVALSISLFPITVLKFAKNGTHFSLPFSLMGPSESIRAQSCISEQEEDSSQSCSVVATAVNTLGSHIMLILIRPHSS